MAVINTAGLRGLDTLQSEPTGTGGAAWNPALYQAGIVKEIEQLLALLSSALGDGESSTDSLLAALISGGSSTPGGTSRAGSARVASYSGASGGGKPVASYFMTHLQKDFNLTPNQAAGIVANLWYESGGMHPNMNEGGHAGAPSSNMGQGYGVAQWTGSRKREFLDFAARNHMNPSSVEANYAFLKHELQTTHSDAIRAVKSTSTAKEATLKFCNVFERPGVLALNARYDALAQVMPSGSSVMV
jgi:hypothetical protein